ncbi:histone-lysine N-methyltransferase KMT5B-A-like [Bolinopsis microptera]|uniref:histone-lysine N-methyltransferase KMT5B-A-like n=1 Tax=Bolinopsis microptera TaxID=2820187 RepID=UPI00307A0E1F
MVVNTVPYYEQLACFDDYATALVVDPILGFTTHKMSSQWKSLRSKKSNIEPIISEYRLTQDAELTFERLMDCHPHWYKYFTSLKTPQQFKVFKEHVIKYIHIQHPLSGFMVSICHRFSTDDRKECKIRVTKKWCAGEFIPKLCGVIAEMSLEEESNFITPGVNDFSVMFSTRKNISQLWLGPAAYINHDCKPNCKFVFMSRDVACVQVQRDMDVGDEVLVYYGDFFFGENNEHCGCKTCERSSKGLFSTGGPQEIGVQIKGEDRSYSLRATIQRSNPTPKRYPHLSLYLADEDEDSIYDLIPRPVIKTDVVIFSKPLSVDSDESSSASKSRECRSLSKSNHTRSRYNRDNSSDSKSGELRAIRDLKSSDNPEGNSRTRSQAVKTKRGSSSSRKRSSGRFDTNYRDDINQKHDTNRKISEKMEAVRKRKLTRSSCVLELVDKRKSGKTLPEVRAITTRSTSKKSANTRSPNNKDSVRLAGTIKPNYKTPNKHGSPRVLRSSGSFDGVSLSAKSSPGSVSSNSDQLFKKVSVPISDRVLRGQRP